MKIVKDLVNGKKKLEVENLNQEIINLKNEISKLSKSLQDLYEIKDTIYKINQNFMFANLEFSKIENTNNVNKILIVGFYGAFNVGDELMLETIISELEKVKNIEITIMLSNNEYCDISRYGNYKFIHYPLKTTDFEFLANKFDVVICGGGAVLDDSNYKLENYNLGLETIIVSLCESFIIKGKKTLLYGLSSIELLTNQEYIRKLDYISKNCTYFSLRDTNSKRSLSKSGIDVKRIKIVDDIVLANSKLKEININKKTKNNILGVVFIYNHKTMKKIYEIINELTNYLKDHKLNYEIKLIPFYDYKDNDIRHINSIIGKHKNIKTVNFKYKYQDVISEIDECKYVISMRYHSTLIANFLGKNVLCINYDEHQHYNNKNLYIYNKYVKEKNIVDFSKITSLNDNLDILFNKVKEKNSYQDVLIRASDDLKEAIEQIIWGGIDEKKDFNRQDYV